jgi:hypothetical protein
MAKRFSRDRELSFSARSGNSTEISAWQPQAGRRLSLLQETAADHLFLAARTRVPIL